VIFNTKMIAEKLGGFKKNCRFVFNQSLKLIQKMITLILLIVGVCLATVGIVWAIDKHVSQKMKPILFLVFGLISIFLGYKIYQSITGPIEFNKVKQERFGKVIDKLKDIRNAQEAYKSVNQKYTGDFKQLVNFIDTGKYIITQQRDSSYTYFDEVYKIDQIKEVVIIDTLRFVSVKDSLFKTDMRYKTLADIPNAANGEKIQMKADIIEKSGYKAPVFKAWVKKDVLLYDQQKSLRQKENAEKSVEQVNGNEISVGSLEEVSTSGNWPPVYDNNN